MMYNEVHEKYASFSNVRFAVLPMVKKAFKCRPKICHWLSFVLPYFIDQINQRWNSVVIVSPRLVSDRYRCFPPVIRKVMRDTILWTY